MSRRATGAGASPAVSTKLFQKLRVLDRKIHALRECCDFREMAYGYNDSIAVKDRVKIEKFDQQRKAVRLQRKAIRPSFG